MDKVIELLNVYRKEKYPKSKLRYYKYDSLNHEFLSNCIPNDSEEKVLGKRFGFIKWLVDNDKIDLEEVEKINQTGNVYIRFGGDCEKVLMLLSIQDNPITFLLSILK